MSETTLEPFAGTLARVALAGLQEADTSALPGVPEGPGWVVAANLSRDYALLDELLDQIKQGYGGGGRALAGTMFLRGYLWRLLAPVVAALLLEHRAPDPGVENVMLRFGGHGRPEGLAFVEGRFAALLNDTIATEAGAVVLPDEGKLAAWVVERLSGGHLPALISGLRHCGVRRSARTLIGVAADTIAESFMWLGKGLGKEIEAREMAVEALGGSQAIPGSTNYYVLEHDGGSMPTRVRNVCCLYYRLGRGACFTCPRTTKEDRLRRLAEG